jgi:GNAT superfamily N-acetyltransferase
MEVPREQRGTGIGGKLLSTALVLAAEHGARRAYAHMAPESRRMHDLLRFYEQLRPHVRRAGRAGRGRQLVRRMYWRV